MTKRNHTYQTMNRRRGTSKRIVTVLVVGIVTLLVGSLFFGEMGVPQYLRMLSHAQQLEREIRDLERANADLRVEIERVQHDPVRIEELARERLGLVRPGETVYQIVEDDPSR